MDFKISSSKIIILILIFALFFTLRLPNLTLQPIFADEAIYIRWAQVMRAESTLRFLPQASEGKQPLFMWLAIPFVEILDDPLFAGRLLSVIAGFGSLVGVFLLSLYLFKSKIVAILASLIYAVSPFSVFINRMALVDSLLSMFGIWTLFLGALTSKTLRLDFAIITGFVLGGAALTKSPSLFFQILLPTCWIMSIWPKGLKNRLIHFGRLASLTLVGLIVANMMYNILRLGPGFEQIAIQNQKYVFPISHLWTNPKDPFIYHLRDMAGWFYLLGPHLLTVLALLGTALFIKKSFRPTFLVLIWALFPLFAVNMFAKVFTLRYIFYTIPPIMILAALSFLVRGVFRKIIILGFVIFIIHALWIDYLLITSPEKANLPRSERSGYLEEWTAGYGLSEIAHFLMEESKKGVVVVGTEGTFGTLPDGLQIYTNKHSHLAPKENQVIIIGASATISAQLRDSARRHPTYFVANNARFGSENISLIKKYPKVPSPDGKQEAILLFRVFPID